MPKGDRYKLKADPEDGTTPVSNLLLEAISMAKLSGLEIRAVLYLWRKTYGWQDKEGRKKQAEIALPEWERQLDAASSKISKALKTLVEKKIIKRIPLGMGKGYIYEMNTHIYEWDGNTIDLVVLSQMVTVAQKATLDQNATPPQNAGATLDQKEGATLDQNATPPATDSAMRKESLKESIKEKEERESIHTHFETFWAAYPRKKSKGQAERTFFRMNPDEQLLATMLAKIEQARTSEEWLKEEGQFIPYPATWLNARGWEDEDRSSASGPRWPRPAWHEAIQQGEADKLDWRAWQNRGIREMALKRGLQPTAEAIRGLKRNDKWPLEGVVERDPLQTSRDRGARIIEDHAD